jgi:hypothetical protein
VKLSSNSLCEADFKRLQEENNKLRKIVKMFANPYLSETSVYEELILRILAAQKALKELEGGE